MKILQRDCSAPPIDKKFHYCSVIGKVNYLKKCMRPDIPYPAHQCARFSKDPCSLHDDAIIHIAKYLAVTKDTCLILDPKAEKRCPIIWASKLQIQVVLSTFKAEYIALLMALQDVIPMMQLLKEMKQEGIAIGSVTPNVHCKAFKDNTGALELVKAPKMRPHTKHINTVYHHF
eukprot:159188-Ditylum_brightwellii.AAC.1